MLKLFTTLLYYKYMYNHPKKWDQSFAQGKDYTSLDKNMSQKIIDILSKENNDFQTILDLGCGTGQSLEIFANYFSELNGLDFSQVALDKTNKRLSKYKNKKIYLADLNDVETWPNELTNKKFSLIISKLSLAFVKDKNNFIKKCHQLLDANGAFLLITPVKYKDKKYTKRIKNISVDLEELESILNSLFKKIILVEEKPFEINAQLNTYICIK